MWKKIVPVIFIFYIFVLLQNSFFNHFSLFGVAPNLVFTLFFLLVFFSPSKLEVILLAVIAGFFIDIFSYTYVGPSIILLIILSILLKKVLSSLKNTAESYPFIYFLPLFVIFLLAYILLKDLYLYFLDPNKMVINLSLNIIYSLVYSSIFATAFFFIYKRWLKFTK
ncbi:MAG: hypothetical protein WC711_01120 [Candidatus Staskawiczbacteria bacterium]|jgi:rod shape-determining protein MreD